jgi:hypothetical protein
LLQGSFFSLKNIMALLWKHASSDQVVSRIYSLVLTVFVWYRFFSDFSSAYRLDHIWCLQSIPKHFSIQISQVSETLSMSLSGFCRFVRGLTTRYRSQRTGRPAWRHKGTYVPRIVTHCPDQAKHSASGSSEPNHAKAGATAL